MRLVNSVLKLNGGKINLSDNISSKYFFIDAEIRQVMQIFLKTKIIKNIFKH